jgi:hypothetical protein
MTYFRHLDEGADPHLLLDPEQQVSTPWGVADKGACDKCRGNGPIPFRCLSCVELGSRPDCPACGGRVEYLDGCPTCAGTGEISSTRRAGVSAFPTLAGLYRYLVERDFDFRGKVMVEFEGTPGDEPDLDADSGALLVHPQEIVTRHAVDRERVTDLRRRLSAPARNR